MNESAVWEVAEQMQGQIAAEIRVMLGESPLAQSMFDQDQRDRRIEAMKKCAAESTGDAERHESWMKMHVESGWVYGEQFDPAAKTHPNLKPWDELPPSTRSKAKIFDIVAKAAYKLASMCAVAIILLSASHAEACNRCGRNPCRFASTYVAPVAVAPVVQPTNVYVVQSNYPQPLVPQGTTGYASVGAPAAGYQNSVLPLVDTQSLLSQSMQLIKAGQDANAIASERIAALIDRQAERQAPAVERLAAGQAAAMVLQNAGLSPTVPATASSSAIVITRDASGVIQAQQLTTEQAAAVTAKATMPPVAPPSPSVPAAPEPSVGEYPMTSKFCASCHGTNLSSPKGGFYIGDDVNVAKGMAEKWFRITRTVTTNKMPPATAPQPTQQERAALISELESIIVSRGASP